MWEFIWNRNRKMLKIVSPLSSIFNCTFYFITTEFRCILCILFCFLEPRLHFYFVPKTITTERRQVFYRMLSTIRNDNSVVYRRCCEWKTHFHVSRAYSIMFYSTVCMYKRAVASFASLENQPKTNYKTKCRFSSTIL